jgi:purine-nucleoside phosphorylase
MTEALAQADETVRFLSAEWPGCRPTAAVVLGSGLGAFADSLENSRSLEASAVPNWPVSTVEGHKGRLVLGRTGGRLILALQGRVHYYEGYPIHRVVFPVRVLARLGIRTLILTNASGGIRPDLSAGDLMIVTDHINCMGTNPLIGPHDSAFGARFPDLSAPYDPDLIRLAEATAVKLNIPLKRGVLAATSGPSYETAAEVRMLAGFGADAVCMSTVPEAIAAAQLKMKTFCVSCIANPATGIGRGALTHDEVRRNAEQAQQRLAALLDGLISGLEA